MPIRTADALPRKARALFTAFDGNVTVCSFAEVGGFHRWEKKSLLVAWKRRLGWCKGPNGEGPGPNPLTLEKTTWCSLNVHLKLGVISTSCLLFVAVYMVHHWLHLLCGIGICDTWDVGKITRRSPGHRGVAAFHEELAVINNTGAWNTTAKHSSQ